MFCLACNFIADWNCSNFQHEAARAAFEDARKQMDDILGTLQSKTAGIAKTQSDLEMSKREAMEARKEEQVCN